MKKTIIPMLALSMALVISTAITDSASDAEVKLQRVQQALAQKPNDAKLLNETGVALYKAGKYAEAKPLLQKSLEIRKKTLGKDHPDVAFGLTNLAAFYFYM